MASKIRRWLRELAVWLLIGAAVSLAVDYFRQPALPQNVSATSLPWCGVCRYTTPSVASLAADGGNVLTVALRSGDNAALEKWLTRKKMTLPTVNDPSGQLARQWDIQVTPTLVVISQGEVKSVTTGWTSGWGMRLRLWLASW
ncbi:MAG: redoxin domain-containing protein [Klebsiella sp.]|nr:redoxin domain-containing protein [Klebsiella sp.]